MPGKRQTGPARGFQFRDLFFTEDLRLRFESPLEMNGRAVISRPRGKFRLFTMAAALEQASALSAR